mgnify:CR=1 FL=1
MSGSWETIKELKQGENIAVAARLAPVLKTDVDMVDKLLGLMQNLSPKDAAQAAQGIAGMVGAVLSERDGEVAPGPKANL